MRASFLGRDLRQRLERDALSLGAAPPPGPVVTEDEVASLPPSAQRYLRFMGVVGRPEVTAFRAHLRLRFRLRRGLPFLRAEAWQYNTVAPIARLFWMRLDAAGGLVPMVGRDSYLSGRGRMLGKVLDRVVVADGQGEPFDIGQLTTWLNDAVLLAPSMLLRAGAAFAEVDDACFEVRLTDAGRTVTARVLLDARGAPVDFRTDDRFMDAPGGPVRTPWSTPVEGWRTAVDGRAVPARGSAVWHPPEGDLTYAVIEFAPDAVEPNPALGEARRARPVAGGVLDAVGGAAAIAATVATSPVLRRWYNRWGASESERRAAMPGDELVPDPVLVSTRALTIEAPSRQRNAHPRAQRLLWRLVEPVGFVMERRMLLGIKERAER